MAFLKSIKLSGLLSFPPDSPAIELTGLNVLIGPNGSGKSNLIECIELLHAAPTAFAAAIRDGGGVQEWLWKGDKTSEPAILEATVGGTGTIPELRYQLAFAASQQRLEVVDETIEEAEKRNTGDSDVNFYYRFQRGRPVLNMLQQAPIAVIITARSPPPDGWPSQRVLRELQRESLIPDESVLSQRKDPDLYPEVTWLGQQFGRIQTFREWSFGRYAALRQPQPADLPSQFLLPDSRNLGLLLNQLDHTDAIAEFNRLLTKFLPRFKRLSTKTDGGTVQFYLHESGLKSPIPATRLSDGTIRFIAMLALLLSPAPPPLICIEEPELGLHPDAIGLLADVLVDASSRTQLVVTTHSDVLVSGFTEQANSVLCCDYLQGTTLTRVESDKLTHWLNDYRLGEVWRIGELGGNP